MSALANSAAVLEHGERYGKLTVLEAVKTQHGTKYRVGCACGYSGMLVRATQLMKGKVTECVKCRKPLDATKSELP